MSKCEKCGYRLEDHNCPLCGATPQEGAGTLGNYGGKILTICCRKDPTRKPRGGKKDE